MCDFFSKKIIEENNKKMLGSLKPLKVEQEFFVIFLYYFLGKSPFFFFKKSI